MKFLFAWPSKAALWTAATLILVGGCQKRTEESSPVFARDENDFQLTILVDLSGSFRHQMADQGQAYQFIQQVVDKFFQGSVGSSGRLIIAQISGDQKSLLWEGSPVALRQDFPSPSEFRDFLYSRSNEGSSRVYENLARTLEYLLDRSPTSSSTRKAVFILSDMIDNASDPELGEAKATQSIVEFAKSGGLVGLYYVDQSQVIKWREKLRSAGATNFIVESEIVSRPSLPNFEY